MILLTGAGGKTGKVLLQSLNSKQFEVRALVYRPDQRIEAEQLGAAEVMVGDLRDRDLLNRAVKGATEVYHICPNVHPDEYLIGQNLISVALEHGVKLIAYHSVLHPHTEKMVHHWQKLKVEELLFESGVDYVIIQPAPYMQNLIGYWNEVVEKRKFILPYNVSAKLSMVNLTDVAEVAPVLIGHKRYHNGIYECVGTDGVSALDLANIFSQRLSAQIEVEQRAVSDWRQDAVQNGMSSYHIEALSAMFSYYDKYGLEGSSSVLSWLLGREPGQLSDFVDQLPTN